MEGCESDPETFVQDLTYLLADILAGCVDVSCAIVFHVSPAEDGGCLSVEGLVCPAVADAGEKEIKTDDTAADRDVPAL